jgi:hypothetical protein
MIPKSRLRMFEGACLGFSLGELLIAVLCLGVLMLPLLAYVSGIRGMGSRIAEESGGRAWQSVQGAAVAEGVDSSSVILLAREQNPGASIRARSSVTADQGAATLGRVSVGVLHLPAKGERLGVSGFHLEPGLRLPEPEVPAQALAPRVMLPPLISPAPGSLVPIASVAANGSLSIQVRSTEGGRVLFRAGMGQPMQTGVGELSSGVSVSALAVGLRGQAWVEFAGELVPGAVRVPLSDGRAEWRVPESGGERLVSPSELVPVIYFLGLGAPVLRIGDVEYSAGAEVPVDYSLLVAVQAGHAGFEVGWPLAIRTLLGADGASSIQGFTTTFQGLAGPVDGSLVGFAFEPGLSSWEQSNHLTALPLLGLACRGEAAAWVLDRSPLQLPPPELAKTLSGPLSMGPLGFRAAEFGELGRIGRLSARSGAVLAAGPSLDLEVTP